MSKISRHRPHISESWSEHASTRFGLVGARACSQGGLPQPPFQLKNDPNIYTRYSYAIWQSGTRYTSSFPEQYIHICRSLDLHTSLAWGHRIPPLAHLPLDCTEPRGLGPSPTWPPTPFQPGQSPWCNWGLLKFFFIYFHSS